jgi:ring-1,2-phenylacetyl-CoA epoxidase subunit PaaE
MHLTGGAMSDRFHSLRIADIRPETERAVCLTLDVPDALREDFRFIPGQYLTLRTRLEGEDIRRSYSICSGIDEGKLRVGIKRVEDGLFSNFANDFLKPGDTIDVLPPRGSFHTPLHPDHEKRYLCICAGSGITPVLAIVKSVLSQEPKSRVTLLFGNRNSASIMFKEDLCFLKNRYMSRFEWFNILSREQQDAEVLCGRLDNRKGAELSRCGLIDIEGSDEFFLCGPESMISEVSRGLRKSGVDEKKIHYELFFASAEDARVTVEKHHARAQRYGGQVSEVAIKAAGRSLQFELSADGENILDAALRNGADLPFSCKSGVCATCKARLVEGQVEMDLNHSLSDEEVAEGMVLSCQAHPVSEKVSLDYDI